MADLEYDLEEALRAGDPAVWRASKEATRRLYTVASEVEKIRLQLADADEALREAGMPSSPPVVGVRELVKVRDALRQELTDSRASMSQAAEVIDLAKGALVATTSPEHPWYQPGEPDGQPGYHCPRCKVLNEIEMWRNNNG